MFVFFCFLKKNVHFIFKKKKHNGMSRPKKTRLLILPFFFEAFKPKKTKKKANFLPLARKKEIMVSWTQFYALVFVVIVIALVASLVVLSVVKSSNKWKYWGIGLAIYGGLSAAILAGIHSSILAAEYDKQKFRELRLERAVDPKCSTERDVCTKQAIEQKKQNDNSQRSQLATLQQQLKQDPNNTELQAAIRPLLATLATDVQRIDDCKRLPATNKCTEKLLDECNHMILSNYDAEVHEQFTEFRKTKDASEVLNFCHGLASV